MSDYTIQPVKDALNAKGGAPVFACRGWVNFDGSGTLAIRDSENVSSVTDNGTGDYTVNFAVNMYSVNYCAVVSITSQNHYVGGVGGNNSNFTYGLSSFSAGLCISQGGSIYDPTQINIAIMG